MFRPVHIEGFAQLPSDVEDLDEAEMVQKVVSGALSQAGLARTDMGFWCSGSNDYHMGKPFSFTMAIDGIGPWPPVRESHVEMDGAWALFEAWVRLQHGDIDHACVYAFGRSSIGSVDAVGTLELDPYTVAPLGPGPLHLAALQARAMLDSGRFTERDIAAVVSRETGADLEALLAAPYVAEPLRAHDGPNRADGAAAIVLSVGGTGPRICGLQHRIDAHQLGMRDLTVSRSARLAAEAAGVSDIDVAELHAPYAHQELLLREALGLSAHTTLNPSGGSRVSDIPMVSGLVRIGEAARQVRGGAKRAVATATAGPCLQHNLVCVLDGAA